VLLVPPCAPEQIAEALRSAMESDLRPAAAETREWVRNELSNRRYAERMVAIYDEALRTRSA
jgi:hypothetical protein